MTRLLAALALLAGLMQPAWAGFAAGAQAYDGGDYAEAFREWHALAQAGDAMAQTAVAGMYRFGEGRPVDLGRAARWYALAARQGAAVAQANLAEMYRLGLGVKRDLVTAHRWFARAARRGNAWAADQLARIERAMTTAEIEAARGGAGKGRAR